MKRILPFLLLLVIIAAAVVGWFVLPDEIYVQFSRDGNTLPKLLTLGVGVAIGALGAVQAAGNREEERKGGYVMMLISAVVLALSFITSL